MSRKERRRPPLSAAKCEAPTSDRASPVAQAAPPSEQPRALPSLHFRPPARWDCEHSPRPASSLVTGLQPQPARSRRSPATPSRESGAGGDIFERGHQPTRCRWAARRGPCECGACGGRASSSACWPPPGQFPPRRGTLCRYRGGRRQIGRICAPCAAVPRLPEGHSRDALTAALVPSRGASRSPSRFSICTVVCRGVAVPRESLLASRSSRHVVGRPSPSLFQPSATSRCLLLECAIRGGRVARFDGWLGPDRCPRPWAERGAWHAQPSLVTFHRCRRLPRGPSSRVWC